MLLELANRLAEKSGLDSTRAALVAFLSGQVPGISKISQFFNERGNSAA
jgi:hypothetical protein